jgi:serine/threonine protein kinase
MEIRAGATLGRYQLLAEIGRGAMGTVFQALDPDIDRLVAVKIFSVFDAASGEGAAFRERFAQEARAAGRLTHPNIVAIYDRGEEPEAQTPYIVMEYVAGQPLSNVLTAHSVRLEEGFALKIAKQVAEALAYAHERGVVHRDVKPSNILITEEGAAKIADFGVARLDTADTTFHGEVMGTPAYMSPEQLMGADVDGRSDIFSLGVILYTMLSGFRPFQGNGASTIGYKVINQNPVPITNFHLDLSKDTEYVVARAMAKNRDERYPTGTTMAHDLADILDGHQPRSRRENKITVSSEVFHVARDYRPYLQAIAPSQITKSNTLTAAAAAPALENRPNSPSTSLPAPAERHSGSYFDWSAATPVFVGAFVVCAAIAAAAAIYVNQSEGAQLHAADAHLGMPPKIRELVPKPTLRSSSKDSLVRVNLPQKPAAPVQDRKQPLSTLDRTVVHDASAKPEPVVTVASRPPVKPWVDPLAARPPATLELALEHHFVEADLSVWVDDQLAFSGTTHGEARKRLFVLKSGIQGRESHEIRFPGGEHEIKVRIASKVDRYDESGSIHTTFLDSQRSVLEIRCNKRGIELKLSDPI